MTTRTADAAEARQALGKAQPPPHDRGRIKAVLTPMIDVTFLLLLFFLLTFTFRQREGSLPDCLPRRTPPIAPGAMVDMPLEIRVLPHGPARTGAMFEIKGRPFAMRTPAALYDALHAQAQLLSAEHMPVRIVCRGDVQWRWALEAYNQAWRAEFRKIDLALPR